MVVMFKSIAPQVDLSRLADFEKQRKCVLPADYRRFLVEKNGGYPDPHNFMCSFVEGGEIELRVFFGLDAFDRPFDLDAAAEFVVGALPKRYLPIGDAAGRMVLLSLDDGAVFLWSGTISAPRLKATIRRVADSFTALLAAPVIVVEPQDPVRLLARHGEQRDMDRYVSLGGDLSARTLDGWRLIEEAAKAGNLSVIRACIERGVSPGRVGELAAMNGRLHVLTWLIDAGHLVVDDELICDATGKKEVVEYLKRRLGDQ